MAHPMVFQLQPRDPPTFGNIVFWVAEWGQYTYTVAEDAGSFTASARRSAASSEPVLLLGSAVLAYDEAVRLCRLHAAHATGNLP